MSASINRICICILYLYSSVFVCKIFTIFNEKMENGGVIIVNRLSGIDLFVVLDMKWL